MAIQRSAKSRSKKLATPAPTPAPTPAHHAPAPSESKGGLVSTKERDYLEQDAAIRGQRYACISFVSPEEVLVKKDVFVLNRFMQDISKDIDIMLTNLLKNVADTSVADTSVADTSVADTSVADFDPRGRALAESVRLIRERHSYLWSSGGLQAEYNAYLSSRHAALDEEFRESEGDLSMTSIRGVKIRGVYGSLDEAKGRAKAISRFDNKFNVFVAEVGCWCPWSPNPDDMADFEYSETQLNTLMKSYYKEQDRKNELYEERKSVLVDQIQNQRDVWAEGKLEPATTAGAVADETP